MNDKPHPGNNEAMKDLHSFLEGWIKKHGLSREKEQYYIVLMLAGRMEVNMAMQEIAKWKTNSGPELAKVDYKFPEDGGNFIENVSLEEGKRWINRE